MKSTQKFEIKSTGGAVLFSCESNSLAHVVELAVKNQVSLSHANLRGANLRGTDLRGANLSGANLSGANLSGANLFDANLNHANLSEANLDHADLDHANLSGVNLSDANLHGANLRGTDLRGTDLRGADIDFSCWPLACKSFDIKVDLQIAAQLAYHFCRLDCDNPEYVMARNAMIELANKFHRAEECGIIHPNDGE